MNGEYKKCPYRIHGERRASLTIKDEYTYNEVFMPCMGEECAGFEGGYCKRNPYTAISVIRDSNG